MGRKVWGRGATVTAADINTYLMDQSVMTFATAAARTTAIPSPTQGMVTWRNNATGPIKLEYYDGSAWVAISFTSPAQTVQGMSSVQTLTGVTIAAFTATDTWSSWTSGGTSPAATSWAADIGVKWSSWPGGVALVEFSLDGGSTVWKRALSTGESMSAVTPRSAAASSTVHYRIKLNRAVGGTALTLQPVISWTPTAPAVTLSVAESLWESAAASTTYGTWTTLGTVGASHRLVAVGSSLVDTTAGLATGAGSTVIARWATTGVNETFRGSNRAVPSGALKVSGTGSLVYVLTEPV